MTRFLFYLFAGLLTLKVATAEQLWEFGTDLPASTEVFSQSGYINIWNKLKEIQIHVSLNIII